MWVWLSGLKRKRGDTCFLIFLKGAMIFFYFLSFDFLLILFLNIVYMLFPYLLVIRRLRKDKQVPCIRGLAPSNTPTSLGTAGRGEKQCGVRQNIIYISVSYPERQRGPSLLLLVTAYSSSVGHPRQNQSRQGYWTRQHCHNMIPQMQRCMW